MNPLRLPCLAAVAVGAGLWMMLAPARADAPDSQPAAPDSLVGKAAPDFKLAGLDGATHTLAQNKGHVVVLDFWATWCVPCRLALPHLQGLYHQDASRGLIPFAVNSGDAPAAVQKFAADNKLTLPVLLDTDSTVSTAYLAVDQFPETVVIAKDGTVRNVFVGYNEKTAAALDDAVAAALNP